MLKGLPMRNTTRREFARDVAIGAGVFAIAGSQALTKTGNGIEQKQQGYSVKLTYLGGPDRQPILLILPFRILLDARTIAGFR
jgi:hypothetical protein